jgi:hypothetical protein
MATKWLTTPSTPTQENLILEMIRRTRCPTEWDRSKLHDTEDDAMHWAFESNLKGYPCTLQQVDDAAYLSTRERVQKILRNQDE